MELAILRPAIVDVMDEMQLSKERLKDSFIHKSKVHGEVEVSIRVRKVKKTAAKKVKPDSSMMDFHESFALYSAMNCNH